MPNAPRGRRARNYATNRQHHHGSHGNNNQPAPCRCEHWWNMLEQVNELRATDEAGTIAFCRDTLANDHSLPATIRLELNMVLAQYLSEPWREHLRVAELAYVDCLNLADSQSPGSGISDRMINIRRVLDDMRRYSELTEQFLQPDGARLPNSASDQRYRITPGTGGTVFRTDRPVTEVMGFRDYLVGILTISQALPGATWQFGPNSMPTPENRMAFPAEFQPPPGSVTAVRPEPKNRGARRALAKEQKKVEKLAARAEKNRAADPGSSSQVTPAVTDGGVP